VLRGRRSWPTSRPGVARKALLAHAGRVLREGAPGQRAGRVLRGRRSWPTSRSSVQALLAHAPVECCTETTGVRARAATCSGWRVSDPDPVHPFPLARLLHLSRPMSASPCASHHSTLAAGAEALAAAGREATARGGRGIRQAREHPRAQVLPRARMAQRSGHARGERKVSRHGDAGLRTASQHGDQRGDDATTIDLLRSESANCAVHGRRESPRATGDHSAAPAG